MNRAIHFSVDDFIDAFGWLKANENTAESIFDAPSFQILKGLHERYDLNVSCFCFYRKGEFRLSLVPKKWQEEFQANSGWLRFGFHGFDGHSNYSEVPGEQAVGEFDLVTKELTRITGGGDCITPQLRIHFCSGYETMTAALAARGVKRLFCGDDTRINYGLSSQANGELLREGHYCHPENHLLYSVTHVRLEKMRTAEGEAAARKRIAGAGEGELVVFTHECYLADRDVMGNLERVIWTDNALPDEVPGGRMRN